MILNWLKQRTENRAGFTDLITQAILSSATADAIYPGALEVAAGTIARAFASAEVHGRDSDMFNPEVMAEIGRDLIEVGESVWSVGNRLTHLPAYDPDLPGLILHLRYSTDIHTRRGIGPLNRAKALKTLAVSLENALAKEAGSLVGYLLPIPTDGNDASIARLKTDLQNLDGKIAVLETSAGGWDGGRTAAPRRDYEPRRLGPNIPPSSLDLYMQANRMILAACGVPTELIDIQTDGVSNREAWRRFLHSTLQPLAKIIAYQASLVDLDVRFTFDGLMASDITGRARAFGSLVQGGMDIEEAAILTGLLTDESENNGT